MATDVVNSGSVTPRDVSDFAVWTLIKRVLEPVASLKLTVALFAMSIFLILAGTFAQVDKDIWEVIGLYFRVWMAWIPFQVFFPPSFFPDKPFDFPGGIYFPGGKLLGLMLGLNLISAHLIRFRIAAKGQRLSLGLIGIAVGCVITWAIIASGSNSKGVLAEPWLPYGTQWIGYQGLLALAALSCGYGYVWTLRHPRSATGERRIRLIFLRSLFIIVGLGLGLLLAWIVQSGESGRPADASLRILWQLTQGTFASMALLGGCWAVFDKRAGIVLLHAGIGLMMFYELYVALTAVETQMRLTEGERTNYVQDIRTFELAVSDISDPKEDKVVVIPKSIFLAKGPIETPELPFRIEVLDFKKNAGLRRSTKSDTNPATAGIGLEAVAEARKPSAGTDTGGGIDTPTAYVKLESKSDGKSLGTYLVGLEVSMLTSTNTVRVDDKTYQIDLRPKRYYKPYQFELIDVKKDDYLGTNTPRNYSSKVHVLDGTRNVDEDKTIWMNNPLRFADETFYQSNYDREEGTGAESTTLSVVANSGWMMPYVGCMLVGIGMLVHFMSMLIGFLTRGDAPELSEEQSERASKLAAKLGMKVGGPIERAAELSVADRKSSRRSYAFATAMMVLTAAYIAKIATPPQPKTHSFDYYRFGQIPVVADGRAKPLDSAAINALLTISGRTSIRLEDEYEKLSRFEKMFNSDKAYVRANQWMAEVIADTEIANERDVFRIENLEIQETIGVKKREGMRYSGEEIQKHADELQKQIDQARKLARKDSKQLSVAQKKILELSEKFSTFGNLKLAFNLQNKIGGETEQERLASFRRIVEVSADLEERGHTVFAVGPFDDSDQWHILSRAWILDLIRQFQKKGEANQTVALWDQILKSYADNKPAEFNSAVNQLLKLVDEHPPRDVKPWVIRLESYINYVRPFTHASILYLVAFVLGAIGWLAWPRGFNRAAFGVLLVTFVLHSAALWARLVISGRPPVTNLYSSAVFIGWGCVLLGLLFEIIYGIGIGNLVAAVAGYATLLIADGLANDGDTFTVLQAVLDTQFWLATHVTCITLGYATTYLAGLFGVAYILRGVCTPSLTDQDGKDIYRMIYGTICFSIFFSFVGTVLGGLWADDSWGRFWGWDPKENAALIIVLWNALALHAKWGGMVKERGLAALAVGGNIFVSWSWWGVNALGAGLHSYGFKQGTLRILGQFILVNLFIIALASLPKRFWWSHRRQSEA